jgi:hypothetical protein
VSAFLPPGARGGLPEPEHPSLQQRPLSESERRARWEVRAAQWRARAIAEAVFGRVAESSLLGAKAGGALRGLLRLSVPFAGLHQHREREARFLAAVEADPVLARVRLVYVIGPSVGPESD